MNINKIDTTIEYLNELRAQMLEVATKRRTSEEANAVAEQAYKALQEEGRKLTAKFEAGRCVQGVDVDALMDEDIGAINAMIDEMEAEADELNDLTPHEGEEEDDPQAYAETLMANAAEMGVDEDRDIPPMPEGEGWMRNTGEQPVRDGVLVDVVFADGDYDTSIGEECDWGVSGMTYDIIWYRKAQPVEQEAEPAPAPERKFKAGDRVHDKYRSANGTVTGYTELGSVEFQIDGRDYTSLSDEDDLELIVDHFAEATAQIEAQAETESTETMEAEPDTAETMQAIAEAVEAVDAEPEAATDETVTEQPETVEAEPEAPDEPKAERKTLDCTDDYTQEEIVAKSGFDPRVQSDDIAAAEREEFNRPRVHNPWFTAKAEG